MRQRVSLAVVVGVASFVPFSGTVSADVVVFTDLNEFLEAAGEVRHLDFETLPDGSPSYSGALITPEFNYTDFGVEFFSAEPILQITGAPPGMDSRVGPLGSSGPRNWIIVEPVLPLTAIGITFSDRMTLAISGRTGNLISSRVSGGSGDPLFLGLITDEPAFYATIDKQAPFNSAAIGDFYYTVVPEPSALLLLTVAAGALRFQKFIAGSLS